MKTQPVLISKVALPSLRTVVLQAVRGLHQFRLHRHDHLVVQRHAIEVLVHLRLLVLAVQQQLEALHGALAQVVGVLVVQPHLDDQLVAGRRHATRVHAIQGGPPQSAGGPLVAGRLARLGRGGCGRRCGQSGGRIRFVRRMVAAVDRVVRVVRNVAAQSLFGVHVGGVQQIEREAQALGGPDFLKVLGAGALSAAPDALEDHLLQRGHVLL